MAKLKSMFEVPFKVGSEVFTAPDVKKILDINVHALDLAIAELPGLYTRWGVLVALAKRDCDAAQAHYRVARDSYIGTEIKGGSKKTDAERTWRTVPSYATEYTAQQTTEYAWNAAQAVLDGLTQKSYMLKLLTDRELAEKAVPNSHSSR